MEIQIKCAYKKLVPIDELKPHPKNPNKHPKEQIERLAKIMKYQGMRHSIKVSNLSGFIVSGHGRWESAKLNGMKSVPVDYQDYESEEQEYADLVADNAITLWAEMDKETIEEDIKIFENFDTEFLGFQGDFSESMKEQMDDDPVPEKRDTKIQDRQIFQLGRHFILCGDSTIGENYEKLFKDVKPMMMLTDPPYGVNYDPKWRDSRDLEIGKAKRSTDTFDDSQVDWSQSFKHFTGDVFYCWHGAKLSSDTARVIEDLDFQIRAQIIWKKQHFAISRGDYHWAHEPCWYAVRKGKKSFWSGDRTQSTIWDVKNANAFGGDKEEQTGHGTQKPIELMARPLRNHNIDVIYDPFLGSGSTLIACEKLGKTCYGIELNPEFCQIIIDRWEKLTCQKAVQLD